ncbi:hypothetical protein ECB98_17185 [Brucellaceae bacterium VT-16-1752]|nr:hypothetical protein ECB98_17185 [Brucellaceae bacterium VT-16-1752]
MPSGPVPVDVQDDTRSASKATLPESSRPVVRCAEGTNFNSPLQLDFPDQFGEPDVSEPTWFREIGSPVWVEPITKVISPTVPCQSPIEA